MGRWGLINLNLKKLTLTRYWEIRVQEVNSFKKKKKDCHLSKALRHSISEENTHPLSLGVSKELEGDSELRATNGLERARDRGRTECEDRRGVNTEPVNEEMKHVTKLLIPIFSSFYWDLIRTLWETNLNQRSESKYL